MTTFSPPEGEFARRMQGPERTSIAAVLALVAGILSLVLCCIPFVGPAVAAVGLLCSIVAFVAIGRSEGRLAGGGLAAGGLVCSIIGMLLGVVVVVGLWQGTAYVARFGEAVAAVQNDDRAALQQRLSSNAAANLTPEALASFNDQVSQSLGKFRRVKPGLGMWWEAVVAMGEVAPSLPRRYQGGGLAVLPLAAEFEKGSGLVLVVMNEGEEKIENLGVAPGGGPVTWLLDPGAP
jgi:hypothetical protein